MVPPPVEADYYAILEISQSETADGVRRAYRRLSLLKHPDKNDGNEAAHLAFCSV